MEMELKMRKIGTKFEDKMEVKIFSIILIIERVMSRAQSFTPRLFCHQLYERMRAVQQSMTMAMAVNMASSSSGFASPGRNGQPISSQNPVGQYVSSNQPSRYPPGQQHPSSNINNGTSSIANIRQHRKRRANSNAIEG